MTDAGDAERKESTGRVGPVVDVGVEDADAHDADDDGQVDDGEHEVDRRRYLPQQNINVNVQPRSLAGAVHPSGVVAPSREPWAALHIAIAQFQNSH